MSLQNDTASLVIAVPGVRAEFATPELTAVARFVSSGMAGTESDEYYVSPELPFSTAQARACLHDLMAMGENYGSPRDLVTLLLEDDSSNHAHDDIRRELSAIAQFEETGEFAEQEAVVVSQEHNHAESAQAAQKVLILAWSLEEKVHELDSLQTSFASSQNSLRDALGVEDEDFLNLPGLEGAIATLASSDRAVSRMSWRSIFDAILRLSPSDARFVTADSRMIADVSTDCDACLTDMSHDEMDRFFVGTAPKAAYICKAPAWKIIGRTRAPKDRPWLLREIELVLCADAVVTAPV